MFCGPKSMLTAVVFLQWSWISVSTLQQTLPWPVCERPLHDTVNQSIKMPLASQTYYTSHFHNDSDYVIMINVKEP